MSANELLAWMDELGLAAAGWIATWWLHSRNSGAPAAIEISGGPR